MHETGRARYDIVSCHLESGIKATPNLRKSDMEYHFSS